MKAPLSRIREWNKKRKQKTEEKKEDRHIPEPKAAKVPHSRIRGWYGKRKQKSKEKKRAVEPAPLRFVTFGITLASMMLGLSLMPLFPQPLPAILAFLIAFVTFKRPKFGMPVGGLLIGLGLMYNLSTLNFISMLGETNVRGAVVFVFLFLFTALPLIFRSHRAAISINMGILAAILLFFNQAYYLAIPLILSAIVIFKKTSVLTVIYYVLISVPLEVMQYVKYITQIPRVDWWVEPGSSPPIFVPLTEIFKDVQASMLQFRLYDTSKVVYAITDQITMQPPIMEHTVNEALSHYLDSIPGIALFLVIVVVLVSATMLLTRMLLTKSNVSADRLLPTITAVVGAALFFLLASGLQDALAFRAQVDGAAMAIGTFATVLFTLPTLLIDYSPKKRATLEMIAEKAQELMAKLQVFEESLNKVKSSIPLDVNATEAKMLIIKDKLNDILSKTSLGFFDLAEIDEKFNELDGMSNEVNNLMLELNISVAEYQIHVNGEWATWIGKFKDIGFEAKTSAKTEIQKEQPLEERIERIKEVLEGGRLLANEIIEIADQVYDTIRSLYDPNLPEKSQSITFAKQKLDEKEEPWIAVGALFASLNNWRKQYSVGISKSMEHLRNSLTTIAGLSTQTEKLLPVLGAEFPKMMENAKKAEEIKNIMEKNALSVTNVIVIRDALQSSLSIAKDVLSFLYEELKGKEKTIESLLPTEEYLWERNVALREQMTSAVEMILNTSKYGLNQVLEKLPKSLLYLDECTETIALYNEKIEALLNYPIAEIAIEDLLRENKPISAQNLPFEPKYSEEFLKLFYSKNYRDFSFDKTNMLLVKKE